MAIWRRVSAYVRTRPLLADGLLAVLLFAVGNGLLGALPDDASPPNLGAWLAFSAACLATVAIRRRWPWVAITTLAVLAAGGAAAGLPNELLAVLTLTYTAAAYLPVRQSSGATILLLAPTMVATVARGTVAYDLNAGVYVLEPEVLGLIPAGREVSIEREIFPELQESVALSSSK